MSDAIEHEVIGPAQERRNVRKIRGVVYSDSPPPDPATERVNRLAVETIERLEAELADLRASSVVVRVRCETCEGDPHKIDRWTCPDCDNGWRLAEGVRTFTHFADTSPDGENELAEFYIIPARLIECTHDGE